MNKSTRTPIGEAESKIVLAASSVFAEVQYLNGHISDSTALRMRAACEEFISLRNAQKAKPKSLDLR
jgi:hypothetical protein